MTYRPRIRPCNETIDLSSRTLRVLIAFSLIAYPVGAVLELSLGETDRLADFLGELLRIAALVAMVAVSASTLGTIVFGGRREKLDEFQLGLRLSALSKAYTALSLLFGAAVLYAFVALDLDLPLPSDKQAWQHICGGFMLAILVLPAAFLLWSPSVALAEVDEEGE